MGDIWSVGACPNGSYLFGTAVTYRLAKGDFTGAMTMSELITQLLGRRWRCDDCGQEHFVPTRWVMVADDAFGELPRFLPDDAHWLVVADEITWEVAGRKVAQGLRASGRSVRDLVLPTPLSATDAMANFLSERWTTETQKTIAVGSGTLNDLVKWVASQKGVPYIAVPTAASVNGYTSPIAALTVQGIKRTMPCHPPEGVMTEPSVVASAPLTMTAAGYADLMSKLVADLDWQMAHWLWGEPYCPLPRRLVAFVDDWDLLDLRRIASGDQNAIVHLLMALILSGIGMTIAGSSAPSSGGEHLLSHWWDMQIERQQRPPALHGLQVGIGTLVALALYDLLLATEPSEWHPSPDEGRPPSERMGEFRERYGEKAEAVMAEFAAKWLPTERAETVRRKMAADWDAWRERLRNQLPSVAEHRRRLETIGAATSPQQIGISMGELKAAILHAREIRRRWTILDTAFLVGILPDRLDEVLQRCGFQETPS
jgi:glycerol-1-phosphate dehydrogenase [NAD(P)+]